MMPNSVLGRSVCTTACTAYVFIYGIYHGFIKAAQLITIKRSFLIHGQRCRESDKLFHLFDDEHFDLFCRSIGANKFNGVGGLTANARVGIFEGFR